MATTFANPTTGYFYIMRAPRGSIPPGTLHVSNDLRLVDAANRAVDNYPYQILAITASRQRPDGFNIPDVREAYQALQREAAQGKMTKVTEAFTVFKRTVLLSHDLIMRDAQAIVTRVSAELQQVTPTTAVSSTSATLPDLNACQIY